MIIVMDSQHEAKPSTYTYRPVSLEALRTGLDEIAEDHPIVTGWALMTFLLGFGFHPFWVLTLLQVIGNASTRKERQQERDRIYRLIDRELNKGTS